MKLTERIRKYIECPQFGNNHYGKWGALPYDQRLLIKKLCDQCDIYEDAADKFAKENQELKNQIEQADQQIQFMLDEIKNRGTCGLCEKLENKQIKELKEQLAKVRKQVCDDIRFKLLERLKYKNKTYLYREQEAYRDGINSAISITHHIEQAKESLKDDK